MNLSISQFVKLSHLVDMLENAHKSNAIVSIKDGTESEYVKGIRNGMEITNESYTRHIQRLRVLVDGLEKQDPFMIDDVDLSGGDEIAI